MGSVAPGGVYLPVEGTTMNLAYEELLDFMTSGPTLEQIIKFEHSPATLERVAYLMTAESTGEIKPEEKEELREFQKAAYFVDQLKIRAQRRLQQGEAGDRR
jgi:hypothetical protein